MPQAASFSNQVRKAQAKKAARIQARRKVGALSQHLVKPKTHIRYGASFKEFLQYHHLRPEFKIEDYEEFDQKVGEFLEVFWETGRSKSEASYALASLQFFRPLLKHRLSYSWKLLKAWNKLELPLRAFPMSPSMAASFAGLFQQWNEDRAAWLTLVGFSLFLRTGELLNLCRKDVLFGKVGTKTVVFVQDSKGAQRSDQHVDKLLVFEQTADLALRELCKNLRPSEPLWPHSSQQFRNLWHKAVDYFQLHHYHVIPYSMRRGGATSSYKNGVTLDQLLIRGRWKSISTARIYLDEALMELGQTTFSSKSVVLLNKHHANFQRSVSQVGKRGR